MQKKRKGDKAELDVDDKVIDDETLDLKSQELHHTKSIPTSIAIVVEGNCPVHITNCRLDLHPDRNPINMREFNGSGPGIDVFVLWLQHVL